MRIRPSNEAARALRIMTAPRAGTTRVRPGSQPCGPPIRAAHRARPASGGHVPRGAKRRILLDVGAGGPWRWCCASASAGVASNRGQSAETGCGQPRGRGASWGPSSARGTTRMSLRRARDSGARSERPDACATAWRPWRAGHSALAADQGSVLPGSRESVGQRVGRSVLQAGDQTARRLRPLERRARITARPPRVFMRTRKPCVRLRRVTEG